MLGVAARLDMQVGVVARGGGPLDRRIFFGLFELLKPVVDSFCNQVTLLNPAFGPRRGPNSGEAAVAIENLDPIAIPDYSLLVVNGGHAIAEIDLRCGD